MSIFPAPISLLLFPLKTDTMSNRSLSLIATIFFVFIAFNGITQSDSSAWLNDVLTFQSELNKEFADSATSPLLPDDLKTFTHLDFFSINAEFRIEAKFIRTPNEKPFKMITSGTRRPEYVKYGEARFIYKGKYGKLSIYQNIQLSQKEGYEDYLFIPFRDLTSGKESYGAGRYLDLKIPQGDVIVIDFNKAYNPLCAYNHKYSCPIPPEENHLQIAVYAGVKAPENH